VVVNVIGVVGLLGAPVIYWDAKDQAPPHDCFVVEFGQRLEGARYVFNRMIRDDQIDALIRNRIQRFVDLQTSLLRYPAGRRVDFHPDAMPAIEVLQKRAVAAAKIQHAVV
jgi:hypothetical protein